MRGVEPQCEGLLGGLGTFKGLEIFWQIFVGGKILAGTFLGVERFWHLGTFLGGGKIWAQMFLGVDKKHTRAFSILCQTIVSMMNE